MNTTNQKFENNFGKQKFKTNSDVVFLSNPLRIRICPPFIRNQFCLHIQNHIINNEDFRCSKKLLGYCLICDQLNKFREEHEKSCRIVSKPRFYPKSINDFELDLRLLVPKEVFVFNVIVRYWEFWNVVKWFCEKDFYSQIIQGIIGNPSNPNVPKLGNITDPVEGNDFIISDKNLQFVPSSPLSDSIRVDSWLKELGDLNNFPEAKFASEEHILDAIQNTFGYLGPIKKYRSINDPFEPAW